MTFVETTICYYAPRNNMKIAIDDACKLAKVTRQRFLNSGALFSKRQPSIYFTV